MEPTRSLDIRDWSFRIPWPGRLWLAVAACLLIFGLYRNINLLSLLGYFLLMIAVLNIALAGRGLTSLKVRRRHLDPVFACRPCPLIVSVAAGRRACLGVRLEERGENHCLSWRVAWIGGRTEQTFQDDVVLPRRGRYVRGPLWAISGYPFGLAERRFALTAAESIYVLPQIGHMRRSGLRRHLRGADPVGPRQRHRPNPAAHGEVHGLRQFRTGDSPRTIHWKTSARRGELMVREFEDAPGDSLLLVLDPALPDIPDAAERFEEAVSLAATIAREWCRGGAERLVLALAGRGPLLLDGIAGPGFVQRALEHLTEAAAGGDDDALLNRIAALPNPPAAVIVVAVGSGRIAGPLARQLRRSITTLDVTDPSLLEFYEPPGTANEKEGGRPTRIMLHPLGS
jgi:uncharacterized protein (DUF58 family)